MSGASPERRRTGWGFWGRTPERENAEPAPQDGRAFTSLFGGVIEAPPPPLPPPQAVSAPPPPPPQTQRRVVDPVAYLVPQELERTPSAPLRVLAIGSCLLEDLFAPGRGQNPGVETDFVLAGFASELPAEPPSEIAAYDCQVLQMALRTLLPDALLGEVAAADAARQAAIFAGSVARMRQFFQAAMRWNVAHGTTTFVLNFMQPQFNRSGRFHPRFSLANPPYYVSRLNEEIESLAGEYRNCHVLDLDSIAASFGRRFVQDDLMTSTNHNARLMPHARIDGRIEHVGALVDHYEVQPNGVMRAAVMAELRAMMRTLRQQDAVKLVVVDLDDTLWKGVSGDSADIGPHMVEGWPLAVMESLLIARARGIMLAILSKNDETRIRAIWDKIFGGKMKLEYFAAVRINWRPKHENMQEILNAMGLLARSVLFIDDNPAERAQMQAAFPDLRMLDGNPFLWRRILLLAPEMQVAQVTAEGAQRTAMMQAQMLREAERSQLSPEDFAKQQDVRVQLSALRGAADVRFARVLELINKTNQFNTTGKRWTAPECEAFLAEGGVFAVFEVQDRYTPYGLVGVVVVKGGTIQQWVMSCRVIGLGVEQAVMQALVAWCRGAGQAVVSAVLNKTEVNRPCWQLFAAAGFKERLGGWMLEANAAPGGSPYVALEAALG
jgi:FkbH-like protein